MAQKRTCAFCNSDEKLTKEHIWPSCIINKYGGSLLTYNGKHNIIHSADPVIKDVCSDCNSKRLNELDMYVCRLFDEYFAEVILPGNPGTFEYDYDLLLRTLLKISFNTARAHQEPGSIATHQRFIHFILKGGYKPKIVLKLQIVTSSKMIDPANGIIENFDPLLLRCGKVDYNGPLNHRFMIRMVAINSFWFYIITSHKQENKAQWKKFLSSFDTGVRLNGVDIDPKATRILVPVNKTTYFHPELISTMLEGRRVE